MIGYETVKCRLSKLRYKLTMYISLSQHECLKIFNFVWAIDHLDPDEAPWSRAWINFARRSRGWAPVWAYNVARWDDGLRPTVWPPVFLTHYPRCILFHSKAKEKKKELTATAIIISQSGPLNAHASLTCYKSIFVSTLLAIAWSKMLKILLNTDERLWYSRLLSLLIGWTGFNTSVLIRHPGCRGPRASVKDEHLVSWKSSLINAVSRISSLDDFYNVHRTHIIRGC